ncbi:MAG: leucyl aminopeptidase [Spirochaetota bacterium]
MKLTAKPAVYNFKENDTAVIFLPEEYEKEISKRIIPEFAFIKESADISSFKGKSSEIMFIPFKKYPNIMLVGLGKKTKITKDSLRENSSTIVPACKKRNIPKINIILPKFEKHDEIEVLSAIAEGLTLADYSFDKYKSSNDEDNNQLKKIEEAFIYCANTGKAVGILKGLEILAANTNLCRDIINESSEVSNPVAIAGEAKKLMKFKGISCRVYGKSEIEKLKMGLLLAVSKGSKYPPQLVVLQYNGDPRSKKHIAIVGKGITFDSGGMNLKPSASIEDMRSDMSGAASCLYAVKAAAELKLKKNIIAVMPLCENMLSNNSYRAGDIFTAYNGKNVEIGNTDAEGRLILADAVAFTEKTLKPDCIIDIATLTGACLVCFGELIAALLSNNDKLADAIFKAGAETGEKVWRLPLDKEYDDLIKSDIADVKNVGQGRNAGTIVGAMFIKRFIKEVPWAHIDIAGTSWFSKARGYRPKYATGFGVRLFVEFFKTMDI